MRTISNKSNGPLSLNVQHSNFEQQFELYKLRAEENERNFLSLRTIEWQVPFQVYAACGAVVATFYAIRGDAVFGLEKQTVAALAIAVLLAVFVVTFFWQWQILRRLHFNRAMQQAYLDAMHSAVCKKLSIPSTVRVPGFKFWWAFVPMAVLNCVAFGTAVVFILFATPVGRG